MNPKDWLADFNPHKYCGGMCPFEVQILITREMPCT